MTELPHSKSCFVCGSRNPSGLKLRFETDGTIVRARFTPRPEHNGFISVIHGGILATVLDELMVWGCAVQMKQFSYCAEMTVRYVSPARPGELIIAEGDLIENRRGRIFLASGILKREDGSQICTSTGKYMPVKGGDTGLWMADFEGTPEQLRLMFGPATAGS
jgi:acyl-coenzyme A thioesterase PaaI-like protein